MEKIETLFKTIKEDSDKRFDDFVIKDIKTLDTISDDAYLEKPIWLGGDEKFACIFIDLNDSTKISNIKQKSTVAKIYDYFTQNAVDILSIDGIKAEYIDVKGDGAFGLYEGADAVFRAFVAGVTFKTFFEANIADKFVQYDIKMTCKIALDSDMLLVRKIGRRKFYNEVWAGKLINNVYKIASLDKKIREKNSIKESYNLLIASERIYEKLKDKEEYTIKSCGHYVGEFTGEKVNLWTEFIDEDVDKLYDKKVFYLPARWCEYCGDDFINNILN